MTTPKLLLTVGEAAQALSVSRNTVYRLIAAGELRPVDIDTSGRRPRTRLRLDDVRRLVDARTQKLRARSARPDATRPGAATPPHLSWKEQHGGAKTQRTQPTRPGAMRQVDPGRRRHPVRLWRGRLGAPAPAEQPACRWGGQHGAQGGQ